MNKRTETSTHLWCSPCKGMHPKENFGKSIHSPSGYAYACKKVVSQRNRENHQKNKDALNAAHKDRREKRLSSDNRIDWVVKRMVQEAKRRAATKRIPFSLNHEQIETSTQCPVFGWELIYQSRGCRTDRSASLDRIDSSRGYTMDNVWIISWRANNVKGDASEQELIAVANAIGKRAAGRTLDGRIHDDLPWR